MQESTSYIPTPYGTPTSNPTNEQITQVSELAIDMLRRTKGWVRLLSILGFIGVGFMALGAIGMIFASTTITSSAGLGVGMGIVYIIFGALYIYPCIKLWNYGTSIKNLLYSRSTIDLETALNHQRAFWKFVGCMAIIVLSLYILMFLFFLLGAVSTTL